MNTVNYAVGPSSLPAYKTVGTGSAGPAARTSPRPNVDAFTPGETQLSQSPAKAPVLTADMASGLADRYDVKNMDRKQYTNLLVELRDAGMISQQEYSAAYGGTMPAMEHSVSWPNGSGKIDFASFLEDCAQLCEKAVSASEQSPAEKANDTVLAAAYSHLSKLFNQIGDASEEAHLQITVQVDAAAEKTAPLTKEQKEVERLTALLKEDQSLFRKL